MNQALWLSHAFLYPGTTRRPILSMSLGVLLLYGLKEGSLRPLGLFCTGAAAEGLEREVAGSVGLRMGRRVTGRLFPVGVLISSQPSS